MNTYAVLLGIENGPRATQRRIVLNVPADSRLSAAIVAEKFGDQYVGDPAGTTYTHALRVRRLPLRRPSFQRPAPVAA